MNSALCSVLRSRFSPLVVALLLTATLSPRPASAQTDPGQQTAQQPNQIASDSTPAYSSSSSQQSPDTFSPNTPVPAQVRSAHTIFLANDGADPNFPISPDAAYAAFSAAIRAWGHYQLVGTAEQADLIFQLHGVAPITDITGGGRAGVYTTTTPAFQLILRDPKTNARLWTITSPYLVAPRRSQLNHWEHVSITNLVSRVKVLAGQPLSPTETATLTTVPNYHYGRAVVILVGATVGVSVGAALLLHHAFENSLANQKASQDAFCTANNIPLSECAGG